MKDVLNVDCNSIAFVVLMHVYKFPFSLSKTMIYCHLQIIALCISHPLSSIRYASLSQYNTSAIASNLVLGLSLVTRKYDELDQI